MSYGIKRHPIRRHRIQEGKAIISVVLTNGKHGADFRCMEWVGDGYELLDELRETIRILEEKHAYKRRRS